MLKQVLAIVLGALIVVSQAKAEQPQTPPTQAEQPQTSQQPRQPQSSPVMVKVRSLTPLRFATMQPLDSATAKPGDDVPLRLVQPLVVNGVTLLPEGAVVHGRITKVKPARIHCRDGKVEWKLDRVPFADGSYAVSEVSFVSPDPAAKLPSPMLPEKRLGPAFWIFAFPFILAVTAPFVVVLLPYFAAVQIDHHCEDEGREFTLPANSTVGVVIRKEHMVRY